MNLSEKEREIALKLFKDFTTAYNARTISKVVHMSHRGALKALKNLEKQGLVKGKAFGRAIHYKISFSSLTNKNLALLLFEEAEISYKRWVEEFKHFEEAEILILFGSVLRKDKKYNDIDAVMVVNKEQYPALMKKIHEKNEILPKKIHPVIQTLNDLRSNIIKKDPIILDAIRTGVIIKGHEKIVEVLSNVPGI